MATTKTAPATDQRPLTIEDIIARNEKTYLYTVDDFGTVEMRGISHGDMFAVRAEHEDENGNIKDFTRLCDDLAMRALVSPKLTPEIIAMMVDAERVLRTIGHHAGHQCGYLTNPPVQDLPKPLAADPPPPADGTSPPSNAS